MSTHWGDEGSVAVGNNAVAEIDNFNFNTSVDPVDDSAMRDQWKTHIPQSGMKSWQGSLVCHFDPTDSQGQEVLVEGASVTLNMYPIGESTGDIKYAGLATITRVNYTVPKDGATIQRSFDFQGNGPLTRTPL